MKSVFLKKMDRNPDIEYYKEHKIEYNPRQDELLGTISKEIEDNFTHYLKRTFNVRPSPDALRSPYGHSKTPDSKARTLTSNSKSRVKKYPTKMEREKVLTTPDVFSHKKSLKPEPNMTESNEAYPLIASINPRQGLSPKPRTRNGSRDLLKHFYKSMQPSLDNNDEIEAKKMILSERTDFNVEELFDQIDKRKCRFIYANDLQEYAKKSSVRLDLNDCNV